MIYHSNKLQYFYENRTPPGSHINLSSLSGRWQFTYFPGNNHNFVYVKETSHISGVEISSEYEDLICYGFDSSVVDKGLPRMVAWPKNAEDVLTIVKYAAEQELKIIPRGAGSGMAGASVPVREDSIILSFEKMRMIVDIDTLLSG